MPKSVSSIFSSGYTPFGRRYSRRPLHYVNPYWTTGYKKIRRSWRTPLVQGVPNVEQRDGRMMYLQQAFDKAQPPSTSDPTSAANIMQMIARMQRMSSGLPKSGQGVIEGRLGIPNRIRVTTRPWKGIMPDPAIARQMTENRRDLYQQMIQNDYVRRYGVEKPRAKLDADIPKNVMPVEL